MGAHRCLGRGRREGGREGFVAAPTCTCGAAPSRLPSRPRLQEQKQGERGGVQAQLYAHVGLHNRWVPLALTVANARAVVHTSVADEIACTVVVRTPAVVFLGMDVEVVQPARSCKSASRACGAPGVREEEYHARGYHIHTHVLLLPRMGVPHPHSCLALATNSKSPPLLA